MNLDNLLTLTQAGIHDAGLNAAKNYKAMARDAIKNSKKKVKLISARVDAIKALCAIGLYADKDEDYMARVCRNDGKYDGLNKVNVTGMIGTLRTMFSSEFVELNTSDKEEHSIPDNEIRVYLKQSPNYVGPRMYIVQKLDSTMKCRYETQTYQTLVCSRE